MMNSSLPNNSTHARGLRDVRHRADCLSKSGVKLEKDIKALQKKEAEAKNDIKFHKLEMERQKGYFLADTDKSEKLEKKLRRLQFDIAELEEEGALISVQVKDALSELLAITEDGRWTPRCSASNASQNSEVGWPGASSC